MDLNYVQIEFHFLEPIEESTMKRKKWEEKRDEKRFHELILIQRDRLLLIM
jgi:hypothetical protein